MMVTRKHSAKVRPSGKSSVMALSSMSKRVQSSVSHANVQLPNVNVLLSVLMPSKLSPIALSQYNHLTKSMNANKPKRKETASMGADCDESNISSPSSSNTLSSTFGSCPSAIPVLHCGSPMSIGSENAGRILKIDSGTKKITTAETSNDTQLIKNNNLIKECNVLLHPVSSSIKTVYLSDKCTASASTKNDSVSLLSMSRCPSKERNTLTDVGEINVIDSISEASNLEILDKSLIEEKLKGQLSATRRSDSLQQRWVKSVDLKQSHYLKHRLSTNISALYGTSTSPRELDEKRRESSKQEENEAEDGVFDGVFTLNLKEASTINMDVEKKTDAGKVEGGIPSIEASYGTRNAKPCGKKWVNSVNLEMSPLIPKRTFIFKTKFQDFPCEYKSEQNGSFLARQIILHDHERIAETSQVSTHANVSGNKRKCQIETTTYSLDILNKEEGACNVSRSESGTENTLKCVQYLNSAIPVPSLKEGLGASDVNGQSCQGVENVSSATGKEKYKNNKMSDLKLVSHENKDIPVGFHENTFGQYSTKKELLIKRKICVEHKKRKRSSLVSLLPEKRRQRTFSSCDFRDPKNVSVQNAPFVRDHCLMEDADDLVAANTIHDLPKRKLSGKTDGLHDLLMCDRSVDSIPEEDVKSQTEALSKSLQIVFQDHTYSRKSDKHETHRHGPNSKDHLESCLSNDTFKKKRASRKRSNAGKDIKGQRKAAKMTRKLSNNALEKKYNLAVPLKELIVNFERLIPNKFNILKIPNKLVTKKKTISCMKKNKKTKREKRKAIDDKGAPQPKRPRVPVHYKTFKPDQINTIKHIGMRYRVAFHLWPHKYSNALQIINQRIVNQNAFWKSIE